MTKIQKLWLLIEHEKSDWDCDVIDCPICKLTLAEVWELTGQENPFDNLGERIVAHLKESEA